MLRTPPTRSARSAPPATRWTWTLRGSPNDLRRALGLAALLLATACTRPAPAAASAAPTSTAPAPVYGFKVEHAYPHDRGAFTEGLFVHDGWLYESTGYEGRSSIRKVALETGKVAQSRDLDSKYFGEGIVAWKDRLIELTWRSQIGFVYDLSTFQPKGEFHYPGEGWALTTDGRQLIMSDGSSELRFLDPDTLNQTGSLYVRDGKEPVLLLNELEWVKGEIWANIWMTDRIARIDPKSGQVVGWIDLTGLLDQNDRNGSEDVLNGIAYDAAKDRVFVTGKQWPKLYEITLVPKAR